MKVTVTIRGWRFLYCLLIVLASVSVFGWWVFIPLFLISVDSK